MSDESDITALGAAVLGGLTFAAPVAVPLLAIGGAIAGATALIGWAFGKGRRKQLEEEYEKDKKRVLEAMETLEKKTLQQILSEIPSSSERKNIKAIFNPEISKVILNGIRDEITQMSHSYNIRKLDDSEAALKLQEMRKNLKFIGENYGNVVIQGWLENHKAITVQKLFEEKLERLSLYESSDIVKDINTWITSTKKENLINLSIKTTISSLNQRQKFYSKIEANLLDENYLKTLLSIKESTANLREAQNNLKSLGFIPDLFYLYQSFLINSETNKTLMEAENLYKQTVENGISTNTVLKFFEQEEKIHCKVLSMISQRKYYAIRGVTILVLAVLTPCTYYFIFNNKYQLFKTPSIAIEEVQKK